MSNLQREVQQHLSDDVIMQLSRQLGAQDPNQVKKAAFNVAELLLNAISRSANSQNGSGLYGAIEKDHDGGILGNLMGILTGQKQASNPKTMNGEGIIHHLLGKQQLDWLIDALTSSNATFKIIINGGQVISDVSKFENYAMYPTERAELLQRLHDSKIEGVLFISGDRHHTEISRLERENAYPLIDITCSPLTAGTQKARDEGNTLQVKDKTFYNRNFGIIDVSGERK